MTSRSTKRVKHWLLVAIASAILILAWRWIGTPSNASSDQRKHAVAASLHDAVSEASSGVSDVDASALNAKVDRSDWPQLFGPTHDSFGTFHVAHARWDKQGPPVVWRRGCGKGYSSPVVADQQLILFHRIGDHEVVECLAASDGERLWDHRLPTTYRCPVAYSDGPYSTPTIAEGKVIAWGAQGGLRCLNLCDGTLLWQRDLADSFQMSLDGYYPVATSPLVVDGKIILNVGGRSPEAGVVAIDLVTGATVWQVSDEGRSYATPKAARIHGRMLAFVLTDHGLLGIDINDGRQLWTIPFRAKNPEHVNSTSPLVIEDHVFLSGYSVGNLCVRLLPDLSPDIIWSDRRRELDSQYNNLLYHDGEIIGFAASDRTLRGIELSTGDPRWKFRSVIGRGSSIRFGQQVLLFGEGGHLGVIRLTEGQPVSEYLSTDPVIEGAPCFSAPAVANQCLFLRSEREIVCCRLD